jgi:two-component system, chemotaxis family, chemotaxis protein CheY
MKKQILLVDDSGTVRNTLKAMFTSQYEVAEASNGQEGLEMATANQFDLFILDVNMPIMDGITLTAELRKLSQYNRTPIIMLTTESRDRRKDEGKKAGATGWVIKPCDPAKLLSVVEKLI